MYSPENFSQTRNKLTNPSALILYNASAGGSVKEKRFLRRTRELEVALSDMDGLGLRVDFRQTRSKDESVNLVQQAIDDNIGVIIVKGGDGTIAPIANKLADAKLQTKLLVIGGGTQNVLRKSLISYTDPIKIAQAALFHGSSVPIDIGVFKTPTEEYPFVSNGGIGLDAHVLGKWEVSGKKVRGGVFYHYHRERNKFPLLDLVVQDNATSQDQKYENILAMPIINGGKYAGLFPITRSNMTDGKLEAVLIGAQAKDFHRFGGVLFHAIRGSEEIPTFQYQQLTDAVISETNGQELVLQHDGEPVITDVSQLRVYTKSKATSLFIPNYPPKSKPGLG